MKWIATLVLGLLVSSTTFAASAQDVERMMQLFAANFASPAMYQSGDCGKNIMAFVDLANRSGIDLRDASIVRIENKSASDFGMVLAHVARDGARRGVPGQKYWYHHVILDYDGWIFDFDFTNEPQVMKRGRYVLSMYLPPAGSVPEEEASMPDYLVDTLTAADYLRLKRNPRDPQVRWSPAMRLMNYTTYGL